MDLPRVLGYGLFAAGLAVGLLSGEDVPNGRIRAAQPQAAPGVFKDEPAAHALYNQMIDAMRKAKSLSFVSRYKFEAKGMVLDVGNCEYRVWLKKPNYFRVEAQSTSLAAWLVAGKRSGTLIGDGSTLWVYWSPERPQWGPDDKADKETRRKSYMKKPAPPGGHSIGHETGLLGAGMSMPIIDPSTFHGYTDSLQPYLDGVRGLPAEKVGAEDCDKIELSIMKHQRSWFLWLSKRDHLPRKLEQIVRVSYDIIIREEWSQVTLNADIPDKLFAWKPPEGWVEWRMPTPEERLLKPGTKAPEFDLAAPDGKRIKLADYRNQVVWLYIWRAG